MYKHCVLIYVFTIQLTANTKITYRKNKDTFCEDCLKIGLLLFWATDVSKESKKMMLKSSNEWG